MTDLPYTYTDLDGGTLLIASGLIEMHKGNRVASMTTPNGEEAVKAARAILAAAGDTECVVISRDELTAMTRAAARSMRERASDAAETARSPERATLAIRALPLLPDETAAGDTYEVTHGLDHTHVRTYAAPGEDFDAGWAAGHAHARADADRIADLEERVDLLVGRLRTQSEHLSQAQAAIRGLESGRVAPRRAVKYTPAEDH